MIKRIPFALLIAIASATLASAQEVEVDKYNITARIDLAQSALDVRATLVVANLSQSSKSKLYLRLTKLAKVSAATVAGAPAQVDTAEDRRVTTLNQLTITPAAAIAPGASAVVEIGYRIEVPETTPLASVYPGEVLMTPEAIWVPMPSTQFTLYGPNTAPFSLTVTAPGGLKGFRVASAGISKGEASDQTFSFDQPLNSLPLIVAGSFDPPTAIEHGGVKIEFYMQPGVTNGADQEKIVAETQKRGETTSAGLSYPGAMTAASSAGEQTARMADELRHIIDFFTKTLGLPPAGSSLHVISSVRAGNIAVPGALVLNEQVFRQDVLDATTIELLADSIARIWIDGRVRVRGREARTAQEDRPAQKARTAALLRDSVPRHLAALYFEDRFGKEAANEVFSRMRWAYTPIARSRRDAELTVQTLLLPTYSAAVFSKGPLVLRLIEGTAGRAKYIAALRSLLTGPQSRIVTFDDLRASLAKDGGPDVDKLFSQWVDTITEPDIVIGIPQPADRPGVQRVNLRNLGTGDMAVRVLAITASGKKVFSQATVPSEDLTSTDILTDERIVSVEVDPDKLIIQTNYDNDAKPPRVSSLSLLNESMVAFNKGEYAQAEAKLKDAVRWEPANSLLSAWLARALAAQNKAEEASAAANSVTRINPPLTGALAWAHITQGQIALARNNPAEAVSALRRAVVEAGDAPAQFAAREMLVRAERESGKLPAVEESIRHFFTQFDILVKQPSSDKLYAVVIKNNLKRFVQGLTVAPPSAWATEILRAGRVDSNRFAVDVSLKVRAEGRDQSGTALFILHRAGATWMLEDVRLFNVK